MTERETGALIQQVTNLCTAVDALTEKVGTLERQLSYGRGALAAGLGISSMLGAAVASAIHWYKG